MSTPFATVDHKTLLTCLKKSYNLGVYVHDWVQFNLSALFQSFHCGRTSPTPTLLFFRVLRGSVLRPILFFIYTANRNCLDPILYAGETNLRLLSSWRHRDDSVISASLSDVTDAWTKSLQPVDSRRICCTFIVLICAGYKCHYYYYYSSTEGLKMVGVTLQELTVTSNVCGDNW